MKLSDADRENIEVLEALDVDENALFLLLCRYFAYRGKRIDGRLGYTADKALEETIRERMQPEETRRGSVSVSGNATGATIVTGNNSTVVRGEQ